MRIPRSVLALVASCLLCIAADAQVLKRTTVRTETVPFGAGSTLSLVGAPVGDISVDAVSANMVEITATIEVQATSEADLAAAALLTGFVVQDSLGRVSIVSVGADSRRKFSSDEKKLIKRLKGLPYRVDYAVKVPKYTNLEIDGGQGKIDLLGPVGHHRISGADSDVRALVGGGDLTANIAKGRMHIELPPSAAFRGAGINASVVSGQISLLISRGTSADIDAAILRSGKINNDASDQLLPRDARKFPFTAKQVMARSGSGGLGIKLTVGDGDIFLARRVE